MLMFHAFIMRYKTLLPKLHSIILKSKHNKSPALTASPMSFLKFFWPEISIVLLKLMNSYRNTGCIDEHQNIFYLFLNHFYFPPPTCQHHLGNNRKIKSIGVIDK